MGSGQRLGAFISCSLFLWCVINKALNKKANTNKGMGSIIMWKEQGHRVGIKTGLSQALPAYDDSIWGFVLFMQEPGDFNEIVLQQ